MQECVFCREVGGEVLYQDELYRVILVDDEDYPGYLRVVLTRHVKELSDLPLAENLQIYRAVIVCEQLLREYLKPEKINLASFGNITPHVHWHIIPRFSNDRHFPNPTWGVMTNPSYIPSEQLRQQVSSLVNDFSEKFIKRTRYDNVSRIG